MFPQRATRLTNPPGAMMSTIQTFTTDAAQAGRNVRSGAPTRSAAFSTALACLGVAYALSWVEMGIALLGSTHEPAAPMVVSHVLVGALYACVAFRLQWARWVTVALGIGSVIVVGPMVGAEWRVIPLAALVTGSALVCKLAASLFLLSPKVLHSDR